MPKSARRKPRQPQRRPTQPAAREARQPLPALSSGAAGIADEASDLDEWDAEPTAREDESVPETVGIPRGVVRTATRARGRVPFLLDDVIKAQRVALSAERDLGKAVARARAHGATWDEVGLAVGMSRQGAAKRWA